MLYDSNGQQIQQQNGGRTMAELFELLESNNPKNVEEAKRKFHETFNQVRESWLLNGLYDYYLQTNSIRSMDILINIQEPHHNYLFDKLNDSIKGQKNDIKVHALTLLGHLVRKQPTWLYRITQHPVFKEMLKLLKYESDILPLLSALLVFVVILPYVASLMKPFLEDVFEIFSRLAAWNCDNPTKLVEEQMVHMQVGLYALFQRLYGMYPCNFLTYLRNYYRSRQQSSIFTHTIQPMLQTVIMHPLLVTTTKDSETTTERWKTMSPHDVVVLCERYSLDLKDRFSHDTCLIPTGTTNFRSRSGTMNSASFDSPYQLLKSMPPTPNPYPDCEVFSPTQMTMQGQPQILEPAVINAIQMAQLTPVGGTGVALQSQEGTSPPEAAIEATPETTPIKDLRLLGRVQHHQQQQQLQSASVVRALNSFALARNRPLGGSAGNTPTHSQPSSPMRKDVSTFNFPAAASTDARHQLPHASAFGLPKRESYANQRLQKLIQDRSQVNDVPDMKSKPIPFAPTSPLRIISSPEYAASSGGGGTGNGSPLAVQRIESPVSQEDEEVLAIVRQGEFTTKNCLRQCDSVLYDVDGARPGDEDIEMDCKQGSPCASGGLHMPNPKQMTMFRNNIKRLRYHSQCGPDGEQFDLSTGSSPGNQVIPMNNMTVRRANSCPEMKKTMAIACKDISSKTLEENEEELNQDDQEKTHVNGVDGARREQQLQQRYFATATTETETQTENFWPMPYEHLFLSIFPTMENTDARPTPAPSPAPFNLPQEKTAPTSVNDILDKFVDISVHLNERDLVKCLKDQIHLLHQQLLFERHRREAHAYRNRTMFTDITQNCVLSEHKAALTDQVKLQENHIDSLQKQLNDLNTRKHLDDRQAQDSIIYWESKFKQLQQDNLVLKEKNEDLQHMLDLEKSKVTELDVKWQAAEGKLLDAEAEVTIAKEQVMAGEKGRIELEHVNRELLLAGELIIKYRERLSMLGNMRKADEEKMKLSETFHEEIKAIQNQLTSKLTALDACRVRITELDQSLLQYDETISAQKKILNDVKDECDEKLKAVESKYQTQLSINRSLEEKILHLYQVVETSVRRPVHSPDTSSCHEVNATLTDRTAGLSPHSSPLSASFGSSSEGSSMALMHIDTKEMKNLQSIVDQRDTGRLVHSSSTIESELNQEALSPTAEPQPSTSKTD